MKPETALAFLEALIRGTKSGKIEWARMDRDSWDRIPRIFDKTVGGLDEAFYVELPSGDGSTFRVFLLKGESGIVDCGVATFPARPTSMLAGWDNNELLEELRPLLIRLFNTAFDSLLSVEKSIEGFLANFGE